MALWSGWQLSRERHRRASRYLEVLTHAPDQASLRWLIGHAPTPETALQELDLARRAIALMVAEHDALDDRTVADVTHELNAILAAQGDDGAVSNRLWTERLQAYTAAMARRGTGDLPRARVARVLLAACSLPDPSPEVLEQGAELVAYYRQASNDALRAAFGDARLPENIRPSAFKD